MEHGKFEQLRGDLLAMNEMMRLLVEARQNFSTKWEHSKSRLSPDQIAVVTAITEELRKLEQTTTA